MHRFDGKTVIITGASGGIGSATARLFAENGADVVVNYFSSPTKAAEVVGAIQQLGRRALSVKADVSNPTDVSTMTKEVIDQLGRIDVLVNNAAAHPPPLFQFKNPDWDLWIRMVRVNIMGILVCSHYVAPYLKETHGNIVNVVMDYHPGGIGYTLTKTAGTPTTRGLARELAPIRVNAVSPGPIDTWGMTKEEKAAFIKQALIKRTGHPTDVANAILFLASSEASYITGETLHVDGGNFDHK
ncbi:MAG: SDR family NAD(P)-dependent oxidoreductase [Promethearchaeota archaeon]